MPERDTGPHGDRRIAYLKAHPRAALAVDWVRRPLYRLRVRRLSRRLRRMLP